LQSPLPPQDFVHKWRQSQVKERSGYQEHFIDLCRLIGHATPGEEDPTGTRFTFEAGKAEPKKRTLTNLYNQRPTWLDPAHKKLDAAVFDAYGWPHDLSDEEILSRLLALNLERAKAQGESITAKEDDQNE
jgi:hypothetical protein